MMDIHKLANALYEAESAASQIPQITAEYPHLTVDEAYAIQLDGVSRRVASGEKVIGMKIGLTSRAMQQMFHVDCPDYGHLTDRMLIPEGQPCPVCELCQPKVEGEIAFIIDKPLKGPGITISDVYYATSGVVAALEIVDSRIKDWEITLPDTIADNGSSARFVLGSRITPVNQVDMRRTGMVLEKNGQLINSGAAIEVLGNPAVAVAWLANALAKYNVLLSAGRIVLAGALTAAQPVATGDCFTASFCGMGSVTAKFC